jgi:4-amino-4-deoxy-L-arabinose transferase-like glycosyltransferase
MAVHVDNDGASAHELPAAGLSGYRPWMLAALLLLSTVPTWFSLTDDPLIGRSEGRYAAISREMAEGGSLLVPHLMGRPHLTKPPLTYWLEAEAMHWLGVTEFSARLPSALAGSLTLLLLGWLGWRVGGPRVGVISAAVLSMMPLFVIVSRVPTTDALLGLFWFSTLVCGYLAVRSPLRGAVIGLWVSVALGLMTKGPVAWVPVGVLVVWLALGRRWAELRRLRLVTGLALSAIPLVTWAGVLWWRYPDAMSLWYQETIGRAGDHASHARSIWFFLPVLMAGLFPATAMANLPGLNLPWRVAWGRLRRASEESLWALGVVLPFVFFSLVSGKLATYLLPLCPPLALLTALMLERWLSGLNDQPGPGFRPPEVVATFFVCVLVLAGVVTGAAFWLLGVGLHLSAVLMAALAVASGWLWHTWKSRPARRGAALAGVFIIYTAAICSVLKMGDGVLAPIGSGRMVAYIHEQSAGKPVRLVLYGVGDQSVAFYERDLAEAKDPDDLLDWSQREREALVLVADPDDWRKLEVRAPAVAARFERWRVWDRMWLGKPWWLMRVRSDVVGPASVNRDPRRVVTAPAAP